MTPYISPLWRPRQDDGHPATNVGDLSYRLATAIDDYLNAQNHINYRVYAEVIAALECVKQEVYRRFVAPYEDRKRHQNGDVFTFQEGPNEARDDAR